MNIKVQPTLSTCGPTSIYNIGALLDIPLNFKELKKSCKTNYEGTYERDFEKTLNDCFYFKKKNYTKISDLKKDLKTNYIILAYDYLLEDGTPEGHYCVCDLEENKIVAYNSFYHKNASKINLKTKNKYLKKKVYFDHKEFSNYFNVVGYLIEK